MEISKSLQEEILTVQTKLKNAIRDHQICVGKLKDDPNNTDILGQIQKIHLHIVSLGRCQKQVVQRLRKEVETFKAENANGAKVSIASLLGLNNNNHITNNNETKLKTGNDFTTKSSKEDYEEIVRNGDILSPTRNHPAPTKERPSSVETISGEDDVIEVSMDENSNEKSEKEEPEACKVESTEKVDFLNNLGLITTKTCAELQNKRAERKRRSTANPQFVYSNLEVPTKRKRHSYLQSGNVPQTRQTTARMNGPSPPPVKAVPPTKSTSPPTSRTVMKSLIPVQKSSTRPNILRSVTESKVFPNKNKIENGPSQIQMPVPTVKSIHSVGNKAVHIPGLPSSLTIERISSDSAVCISCRNPGTLTVCENCASNYHVSCHSVSPAPSRICPKCAVIDEDEIEDGDEGEEDKGCPSFKKDEEFATATLAPGIIRKAREDAEIYKTACGLHKIDATQKKRGFSSSIGIGQLPSSTFLIPISSNSVNQSDVGPSTTISSDHRESAVPYSSIVLNQLPRSSFAYIDSAEPQVSYAYQLPVTSVQSEKHQSYLIVKKITEPPRRKSQSSSEDQNHTTVLNYKLPTTSGYNSRVQTEISVSDSSMFINKLSDSVNRNRKKQTNRAIPALNRIVDTENVSITAKYQLERTTLNGRKPKTRQQRRFGFNPLRTTRATEILLPSCDSTESDKQLQITKSTEPEETTLFSSRAKYRPRTGGLLHSLFSGYNKSYILTDNSRESSRDIGAANKDLSVGRQQLHHQSYQLESGERNEPVQLQRGALTKFFEHVKLEEAHIPAPSRAKLVYKSGTTSERNEVEVTEVANEETNNDECATKASSSSSNNFVEDGVVDREVKQTSWLSSKILTKKGQKNNNTIKSVESQESTSNSVKSNNFITYGRKRGNTYVRVECEPDDDEDALTDAFQNDVTCTRIGSLTEIVSESRKDRQDSVSICNAQNNFLELRNEVSVPDDKADSERQDLSSGRCSTSTNSTTSTSDSDTPEQAMNDSVKYSRRRLSGNEYKERLGINAVSPESMQVLEQFESAMLETGCSNAATC
ncbi:hypothetical protein K0M31_017653 [Melipona bicolor]|uniref:PHD finger protein 21A n=1 Tax=Melipona bicolor TaxID=60889 RepID=A0AA40KSM9_9HYME|nr:hypothetical protein K0M31_017653 [Melipona bicolor]